MSMRLDLEELFPDEKLREQRIRLREHWHRVGYYGDRTIADQCAFAAEHFAGTRLVFTSREHPATLTMAELWGRARRLATVLAASGVRPGDVCAVQLPNWGEAAISYVAAAAVGAVAVPIVHTYGSSDVDWILDRTSPSVLFVPGEWDGVEYTQRLADLASFRRIPVVVVVGSSAGAGTTTWETLESEHVRGFESVMTSADEPFLVTFTSGTTGEPKGVVHSHNSFLAELRSMPSPPANAGVRRAMQPWPAGHIGGMTAILGPLVHGLDTYMLDRWETGDVVALVRDEHIDACSGVPTMLLRLLDHLEDRGIELPLREVTTGGAGIPVTLIERAQRHGWHVSRCYGSSEHPSATNTLRTDSIDRRLCTEGRAMDGTTVRIQREDGSVAGPGEVGEVALMGPEQCVGYTSPALNLELFTTDGWLRTGDIGILDEDGFLTITDRKKDLIIRGGENISAIEIEEVLLQHPSVAEAAAIAAPDPVYGERVCAFVLLRAGAVLTLDDVRMHFARRGVTRLKTPERLEVVQDLPRTASGKVQKNVLRDRVRMESACLSSKYEDDR
jgi:acyl-CoA synthetase (AMP-forming)/AMP-acid ligase II